MRLEAKLGVETFEEAEESKEAGLGKYVFRMRWGWTRCQGGGLGVSICWQ